MFEFLLILSQNILIISLYSETKAKVDFKSSEYDNDDEFVLDSRSRHRIRPAIAELTEYGKRYTGKNVTRKTIQNDDYESTKKESDTSVSEEDEVGDDDEEDDDDDDEEGENDDDDDNNIEEFEEIAEKKTNNKNTNKKPTESNGMSLISLNHNEEIAKGKAVKNQLSNTIFNIDYFS